MPSTLIKIYQKKEHNIAVDLIKNLIIKIDGVERALTIQEILELPKSYHNDRLKNMIDPVKSPDVYILLKENWLWKNDYGSSHGLITITILMFHLWYLNIIV